MTTASLREQERIQITLHQIIQGLEGIVIISACYLSFFLKSLRDRWGLTENTAQRFFIGDYLVVNPKSKFAHAVEIDAPAEFVWPWIAQMGQGRGGFYSYEFLENMFGLKILNADSVLAEFQNPEVGDVIPFSPNDAYPIIICEPGRAMVIENCYDLDNKSIYDPEAANPDNYLHLSWLWYVEPLAKNRSRFISRNRVTYSDSIKNNLLFGPFSEPIVFAMDRKMCLGIKKRAERLYQSSKG